MISLWMIVTVAAVVGVGFACFSYLSVIPAVIAAVVGIPAVIWLLALADGLWRKSQPLRPFDVVEHQKDAEKLGATGCHITTTDGRVVEYRVYGSKRRDAKVIVQMHGQGCTAGSMSTWYASLCEEFNLNGIAPSTPGNGYSDIHVGRRIIDFPLDLEAILEAEGVGEFIVEGMSLGTPQSPPSHGEWLVKQFGSKPGVQLNMRSEELGFGHFTYGPSLGPEFRATEESIPKTLLALGKSL